MSAYDSDKVFEAVKAYLSRAAAKRQCANSNANYKCPNEPMAEHIFCEWCYVSYGGYPLKHMQRNR